MSTQPTDAELKALWQLHAADIGGIFYYTRAVLAKWGTLRADKIVIPTDTMEQEFQQHYRRGYEAGKKAATPQPTQVQPIAQAAEPVAWLDPWTGTKVTTDYDAYGKHGIPLVRQQPVAREPLTPEQIQDLLLCGDPTDEEMRLIRIGWDAALGIKGGQHGTE